MTAKLALEIDAAAINTYCSVVFDGLEGIAAIRMLAEKGIDGVRPVNPFVPVRTVSDEIVRQAELQARHGRGVFVVPGTVARPGRAKAQDILQSAVLLVDLDEGDIAAKLGHLETHLGPATLVVASGGETDDGQPKLHGYWRLAEPAAGDGLVRLAKLRKRIGALAGGDPSFDSLHQPIRVAGTIHGKHRVLSHVRIVAHRSASYTLSELETRTELMPAFPGAKIVDFGTAPRHAASPAGLLARQIRAGAADDLTRFAAVGKVIGHWLYMTRAGRASIGEAWERVQGYNAACLLPAWDEERLAESFRSLLAKDIATKGAMPATALMSADSGAGLLSSGPEAAAGSAQSMIPVNFSEDDLARRFAEIYQGWFRYAPLRGCWMRWTGTVWRVDEMNRVRDSIRLSCRAAARELEDKKVASRISSDRTIMAVERLSRADPAFATGEDAWDNSPMVINTQNGVLDLETGILIPHSSGFLFTRIAGGSPHGACPTWLRFLDEVAGEKPGLIPYLQRVAGYCLTGSMVEQTFFFFCGSGANGKSVFLSVLTHILGDYAATAAFDTFTAGLAERHPTDLAGIVKARIAVVTETEHGKAWAEGRIKAITGGDRLRVRFIHRDFFEADPTFKILVAGNNRPRLRGVGQAMRRRLHLIPFDITIPPEKRDKDLLGKLKAEKDGIFKWMLDGCRAWQEMGLAPPACVTDAAEDYFQDEDLIGQWIDECCEVAPGAWVPAAQLYTSWRDWAEGRGFEAGSHRSLGEELRARGFSPVRKPRARGWSGYALRPGALVP